MEEKTDRRVALVCVPENLLREMFTGRVRMQDAPPDLKVLRAQYDFAMNGITFVCESESFEPVAQGTIPPYWNGLLRTGGDVTCCGKEPNGTVFYNPFNNCVQCHACGHLWFPSDFTLKVEGS